MKKMIFKALVCLTLLSTLTSAPVREFTGGYKTGEGDSAAVSARSLNVTVSSRLWELLRGNDDEERTVLIPGGAVFGAKVCDGVLTVTSAGEIHSIKSGDKLLSLDGIDVKTIADVRGILDTCGGKELIAVLSRGKERFEVRLTPTQDGDTYRLGIQLKDSTAGIGTITYIDPETCEFGGLGHGICDSETGEVISITGGTVTGVILSGCKKGEAGKPGELSGILTEKNLGEVTANTELGIFGKLNALPEGKAERVKIAKRGEVHTGRATIISTIKNGKSAKYEIEITEVDTASVGTKCFKIRVSDPTLIALTGGIVRGMSGSPIIQDGKLVGAVTHVMVANPTEGYGIFIENMLNAAQSQAMPKAA